MPYRVELSPAAQRSLQTLPREVQSRLAGPIITLAAEPRPSGVRKLKGQTRTWRLRIGPFRVVYDIYDDRRLIVVLKVVRRSESTYTR